MDESGYKTCDFDYDQIMVFCNKIEKTINKIDYLKWIEKKYAIAGKPFRDKNSRSIGGLDNFENKIYQEIKYLEEKLNRETPSESENTLKKYNIKWNQKTDNPDGYSKNDFLELVKALIVAKAIIGKQDDIVKGLASLLEINVGENIRSEISNVIKSRNNKTQTKFLDTLKQKYLDHLNKDK